LQWGYRKTGFQLRVLANGSLLAVKRIASSMSQVIFVSVPEAVVRLIEFTAYKAAFEILSFRGDRYLRG
jgi:hypothetical protein